MSVSRHQIFKNLCAELCLVSHRPTYIYIYIYTRTESGFYFLCIFKAYFWIEEEQYLAVEGSMLEVVFHRGGYLGRTDTLSKSKNWYRRGYILSLPNSSVTTNSNVLRIKMLQMNISRLHTRDWFS